MAWWVAHCDNDACRVITFKWREPGNACPSCGWIGRAGDGPFED